MGAQRNSLQESVSHLANPRERGTARIPEHEARWLDVEMNKKPTEIHFQSVQRILGSRVNLPIGSTNFSEGQSS
jgi:hypothetical protein